MSKIKFHTIKPHEVYNHLLLSEKRCIVSPSINDPTSRYKQAAFGACKTPATVIVKTGICIVITLK